MFGSRKIDKSKPRRVARRVARKAKEAKQAKK
jgi:hypothetical protein